MLAGLLYPTRGTASVLGYTPWERHDGYRRQFALLLGQKNQLWWDLPARESLALNAKIYGLGDADFQRTVDELSELLNVRDKLATAVRELSLGERMKCEQIASLLLGGETFSGPWSFNYEVSTMYAHEDEDDNEDE